MFFIKALDKNVGKTLHDLGLGELILWKQPFY